MFCPRKLRDIRRSESLSEGSSDISDCSATDVADYFSAVATRDFIPQGHDTGSVVIRDESINHAVSRAIGLSRDMDPRLVSRVLCTVGRMNKIDTDTFEKLLQAFIPRVADLSLGCLSRCVFVLGHRHSLSLSSRSSFFEAAVKRADELLARFERAPARVLAKLCVGFSGVNSVEVDQLSTKLDRLCAVVVDELDISQVQQIAYALTRRIDGSNNRMLVSRLISRAITLAPIHDAQTYVALTISISRLGRCTDEWRVYEKIFRDSMGVGSGYISRQRLKLALGSIGLDLEDSDPRFQQILNSLKPNLDRNS